MAIIDRNEFGAIAVNKKVLSKLVADCILQMNDLVFPCNKKGKIIKNKPTPFIDPDLYDSIELEENRGVENIVVYVVIKFGISISNTCNQLIDLIEEKFLLLKLDKPAEITVYVKGVMANQVAKRDIKVNRINSEND